MAFSISNKISEWNNTIALYENAPDFSSLLMDRVRALYENVRQEEAASKNLLGIDASLQQEFAKVEKRVYCLFLRCVKKEIQNESSLTNFDITYIDPLIELLNRLYQEDDSKTAELILKLPEDMRNVFFKNLWIILGKPASPYKLGEYAFLNTNSCSATAKDKYTALISSFSEEPQLLLLAGSGNEETLRLLFSEGRKLSEAGLSNAAGFAAKNGHTGVLEFLLSEGRELSQNALDIAARKGAGKGHTKVLEVLLSEGRKLSQEGLDLAACWAAKNGHAGVLKVLLSEGRQLSQEGVDKAAWWAATNGHKGVLDVLLSEGRQLSQEGLDEAAAVAVHKGYRGVLFVLLSQGRQLSQARLENAALYAAKNGHTKVLEVLLSADRQITDEARSKLVWQASMAGHLVVVEFLLSKGPITTFYQNLSIAHAGGKNRENIRAILRGAQIIPSYDVRISLQAIKQDPLPVLEWLAGAPLPNAFILKESPQAIDLGGPSKQVYSTLFGSLLEKKLFHVNDNGLACIEHEDGLKIYHTLGAFYSRLIEKNKHRTDLLLTGHVFSSAFFSLVKIMVEDPNDNASFLNQLERIEKDLQPFIALLKDKENDELRNQVNDSMVNIFCDEGDAVEFAEKVIDRYLKPVRYLFEGASKSGVSDNTFFSKVRELTPEELAEQLQGKAISKELVLSSLKISNNGGDPFKEKIEWLTKVISDADEAWLQKFVFATTGRYVLTHNTTIRIQPNLIRVSVFEFHPCGNILDLPSTAMTQEQFLDGLEASLNS